MLSDKQQLEKDDKIKKVLIAFLSSKKTIEEISEGTGISKSSVQRYLTDEDAIRFIYTKDADFIIEEIKRKLEENKKEGLSKGGINFAKNNISTKDENGHFTGSKKR